METVLISGGNGVIGQHLSKMLIDKGYRVLIISRKKNGNMNIPVFFWDIQNKEIQKEAIINTDYVIHLAGANIGASRWTKARKQEIIDSRIASGQLIYKRILENKVNLKAFISASAVGYYGTITSDKIFRETDPPADDFLGMTCQLWEKSAENFEKSGIRTVKIRSGVVLSLKNGILAKMVPLVKWGFGLKLGNGKQYIPWLHINDLCGIYIKAIEDKGVRGSYNAVAPDHISNGDFIKALAHKLDKPCWFANVPAIVLRILYGKMSDILLKGSRVSSEKIVLAGYKYQFPDIESTLDDLLEN